MNELDRWAKIVKPLIAHSSSHVGSASYRTMPDQRESSHKPAGARNCSHDRRAPVPCTSVMSVERNERRCAVISWSDPTRGHYVEQVWIAAAARGNGCCALTGRQISKGDSIYRPQLKGMPKPFNGSDMILALELELALKRSVAM